MKMQYHRLNIKGMHMTLHVLASCCVLVDLHRVNHFDDNPYWNVKILKILVYVKTNGGIHLDKKYPNNKISMSAIQISHTNLETTYHYHYTHVNWYAYLQYSVYGIDVLLRNPFISHCASAILLFLDGNNNHEHLT